MAIVATTVHAIQLPSYAKVAVSPSKMPCDLGDPSKQQGESIVFIEVVGLSAPPDKVAFSTNENNRMRIEVSPLIAQVVNVDTGPIAETTAATIPVPDVFSQSLPMFCCQEFVHASIYDSADKLG